MTLRGYALPLLTSALLATTACGGSEETPAGPTTTGGGGNAAGASGEGGGGVAPGPGPVGGEQGMSPAGNGGANNGAGSPGVDPSGGAPAGGTGNGGSGGNPGGAGGQAPGGGAGGAAAPGPDEACLELISSANAFIDMLDDELKARAMFPWEDDQQTLFEFLPKERANDGHKGLPIKDMSEPQRAAFDAFLDNAFSMQGVAKISGIRELENALAAAEGPDRFSARDPLDYFISVFGEPNSEAAPWGFRLQGHHLSLHTSMVACQEYTATPAFWGASQYQNGQSPLQAEADLAKALFDSLGDLKDAAGAGNAGTTPIDDKTKATSPYPDTGASSADFDDAQKAAMMALIRAYTGNVAAPIAANRIQAVEDAGLDKLKFVYKGDGYYRLQGPTFIIEHAPTNENNHVHAIWRDFDGDWGADLIQRHMAEMHAGE